MYGFFVGGSYSNVYRMSLWCMITRFGQNSCIHIEPKYNNKFNFSKMTYTSMLKRLCVRIHSCNQMFMILLFVH